MHSVPKYTTHFIKKIFVTELKMDIQFLFMEYNCDLRTFSSMLTFNKAQCFNYAHTCFWQYIWITEHLPTRDLFSSPLIFHITLSCNLQLPLIPVPPHQSQTTHKMGVNIRKINTPYGMMAHYFHQRDYKHTLINHDLSNFTQTFHYTHSVRRCQYTLVACNESIWKYLKHYSFSLTH
jgi:hypothetical protein